MAEKRVPTAEDVRTALDMARFMSDIDASDAQVETGAHRLRAVYTAWYRSLDLGLEE